MAKPRHVVGGVLIGIGLMVFPAAWVALVIAYTDEYPELMRFLARSDAHVFFDLPGTFRAYEILYAGLPAAGATLIAAGIFLIRGKGVVWSWLVGLGIGVATLLVAVLLTP
jgi:hypothetical protein